MFLRLILLSFISFNAAASSSDLGFTDRPEYGLVWNEIGRHYDIDPILLYSIALTESGIEIEHGRISPWPFTFRAHDARYYADDMDEAVETLKMFVEKYGDRVDVGMGQINLKWHAHRVNEKAQLLDPATNLSVMAQILKETMASTEDMHLGIGRYHSWTEDRARWYAGKVLKIYFNLASMENNNATKSNP